MKNKEQINQTIDELLQEAHSVEITEKEKKAIIKKLTFIRVIHAYLETEPSRQFLEQERDRLESLIDKIEDSWSIHYKGFKAFYDNLPKATITAKKKDFLKDLDLAQVKAQLKAIIYILS